MNLKLFMRSCNITPFALASLVAMFCFQNMAADETTTTSESESQTGSIYVDDAGNVHIHTGPNGSLIVNHADLLDMVERQTELTATVNDISTTVSRQSRSVDQIPSLSSSTSQLQSTINDLRRVVSGLLPPRIYTVGGVTTDLVEWLDMSASVWKSTASLTDRRFGHAVAVYQDKLYAMGGADFSALSSVERFDGLSWETAPSLNQRRYWLAAAVYKGLLYAIGGTSGSTFLSTVESFNGFSWSQRPSMPTARRGPQAAVFNEKLYVVGGRASGADGAHQDRVEAFDGSTWTTEPAMTERRNQPGLVVFDKQLVAIGGSNGAAYIRTMEFFNGTSWTRGPARLQQARNDFGCVVFNGKIYAIGGNLNGNGIGTVEVFDGVSWQSAPSVSIARNGLRSAVFPEE